MEDAIRGEIQRIIKTEIEKGILSRIEWVQIPDNEDFALGYMVGLLEEKALHILSTKHSMYRFTIEQKEEAEREAKEMIRDSIPKIQNKMETERLTS